MSGPRKTPAATKALRGTNRRDRQPATGVELPLVEALPDAPDWLTNGRAVAEWRRLAQILMEGKLLTEGNLSLLAQLCALTGQLAEIWAAGSCPTASLLSQHRVLSNNLGLTPSSRVSLTKPVGGEKVNRFIELRDRLPSRRRKPAK